MDQSRDGRAVRGCANIRVYELCSRGGVRLKWFFAVHVVSASTPSLVCACYCSIGHAVMLTCSPLQTHSGQAAAVLPHLQEHLAAGGARLNVGNHHHCAGDSSR